MERQIGNVTHFNQAYKVNSLTADLTKFKDSPYPALYTGLTLPGDLPPSNLIHEVTSKYGWFFLLNLREELKEAHEQQAKDSRTLYEQNDRLEKQNQLQLDKIAFLVSEASHTKDAREQKEALKEKRKAGRGRRPLRVAITKSEFDTIMSTVQGKGYAASRTRMAFILLYCTGLRVSNLLLLKRYQLEHLLEKQETEIPLIKRGNPRHFISIGTYGARLMAEHKEDVGRLLLNKQADDFVFSAKPVVGEKPRAFRRDSFDKELNSVLHKASAKIGKHIRTHSFRATFITDMIESGVSLHVAKDIIGHKDIKSTHTYIRTTLTQKDVRSIVSRVNKSRSQARVYKKEAQQEGFFAE